MNDYTEILNAFSDYYSPANSFSESDDQLSTLEISEKIQELTLKEVEGEDLFIHLQEYGFQFKYTPDGFRWLLKIKQRA
ncbi:MAG: hypothetical protein JXR34_11645 [Bacteroidales bacterium]|nr:hypothetical protein [Bacteroidales bacterium]